MNEMTVFDIVVLLFVGGGLVMGFSRGLVQEVLSLCAWVAALVAVRLFHGQVAEKLADNFDTAGSEEVLSLALLFGVTLLICREIAHWAGAHSRVSSLGGFDRGLGAGFGAIKGLLMATLLFTAATLFYDAGGDQRKTLPEWITESRTYPALAATSAAVSGIVAQRRANALENWIKDAQLPADTKPENNKNSKVKP